MTADTEKLIERLAQGVGPVRPLSPPWIRTAAWLLVAIPYVALVVFVVSPRPDLLAKASEWRYLVEQLAALVTGTAAAAAAFGMTIPGYDRRILFLPALPLAVWLGSLGEGCIRDWIQFGPDGLSLQPDWFCFPSIVLVGAVPPHLTTALGGLAAAGLGNFGLRLFHPQDASVMVFVWQVGTVFILTAIAAWAGRYLLNWHSIVGTNRRSVLIR